jgi:hypothetical protein
MVHYRDVHPVIGVLTVLATYLVGFSYEAT